jgi:hypothetical protein
VHGARLALGLSFAVACHARIGDGLGEGRGLDSPVDAAVVAVDAAAGPPIDAPSPADAGLEVVCDLGDRRVQDPVTGHCYIWFAPPRTWLEAGTHCAALGTQVHLATVAGQAENDLITSLQPPVADVWLGASDVTVEGQWQWLTEEALVFTAWRSGEPNNFNNEDCMVSEVDNTGTWDDRDCTRTFSYVCEYEPAQ